MSPRRYRVFITQTAHEEFSEILAYTEEGWGAEQRDKYRDVFVGTIERLSRTPLLGTPRDELRPGLRSVPMGSHVIYYSVIDDVIYVRRVLHRRRRTHGMGWETPESTS